MSHFYGTIEGSRGEATRCGTAGSGMRTNTAGWQGAIAVNIYHSDVTGCDRFNVSLVPWQSSGGESQLLASGVLNASHTVQRDVSAATVAKALQEMSKGSAEHSIAFAAAMLVLAEAFEADNSGFDSAAFLKAYDS